MEDAVRPRIALPGWWVRRRLVRAAAAPSAMRRAAAAPSAMLRARCLRRRRERREDGRGKLAGLGSLAREIRACQQRRGRAHQPSNHPSFYLTTLLRLSQTYFDRLY